MSTNEFDLRALFESWPYDAEDNIRIVDGTDGRPVLQVRLPVGIEQYELDGRPDGSRPHDCESSLAYYKGRLANADAKGQADRFALAHEQCHELFEEGVLFYYRYLNLFQLKEWDRVIRDTGRNLEMFDFVKQYAAEEEDRLHLEQWRPYILRMNAVARAMIAVDGDDYDRALKIVRQTVTAIENLEDLDNPTFTFERDRSLNALRDLASHIDQTRPISPLERLERELQTAVEAQEFERAAKIRDKIRNLQA